MERICRVCSKRSSYLVDIFDKQESEQKELITDKKQSEELILPNENEDVIKLEKEDNPAQSWKSTEVEENDDLLRTVLWRRKSNQREY
ncbi:uncharacterized protein LOC117781207 [Drosophila innubila]|uniref:uncharacterized protein LOC117781207 n=1 Tax=Drosophila innubila TaxID=198719 RepID=UPI00148C5B41|nr:uncharacterized protein LOC117781207 [Drosophila innubila]